MILVIVVSGLLSDLILFSAFTFISMKQKAAACFQEEGARTKDEK